jgi:hypothetical protein
MHSRLTRRSSRADRRRRFNAGGAAILLAVAIAMAGCGGPERVPAGGQVKLDGKLLADCAVVFVPVGGGAAANATTDAEGRFRLATTNRQDVIVGDYAVTITKQNVTDVANKNTGEHRLLVEWLTPQKFSRSETSGLRKTISAQEHDFVFDLSSK